VPGPGVVAVCPSAVVAAPASRVWALLTRLEELDGWLGATLVEAHPDGPLQPGQRLTLSAVAPIVRPRIDWEVQEVDREAGRLRLLVRAPLGLVNNETITISGPEPGPTLVRFG
jgi:Polyketide cyclase / dehydrase and lipid transport